MTLIPHFVQNEVGTGDAALLSAFNFCDPFDHILPPVDSDVSPPDRAHLWGLYTGIVIGGGAGRGAWLPLMGVG